MRLQYQDEHNRLRATANSMLSSGDGPLAPKQGQLQIDPASRIKEIAKKELEEKDKMSMGETAAGVGSSIMGVAPFLAAIPGVGPLAAVGTALGGGILSAFGYGVGKD